MNWAYEDYLACPESWLVSIVEMIEEEELHNLVERRKAEAKAM
jgi:hypothetical protein|tara:strand:- start:963 stop:1091 length:129 start_codon:yes stop_codon:yes gene_type:complete